MKQIVGMLIGNLYLNKITISYIIYNVLTFPFHCFAQVSIYYKTKYYIIKCLNPNFYNKKKKNDIVIQTFLIASLMFNFDFEIKYDFFCNTSSIKINSYIKSFKVV